MAREKLAVLDQATYSFADRYVTRLSEACDQAAKDHPNPEAHRQALRIKLHHATSTYGIATSPSPLGQLLDLLTIVTLEKMSQVDEGRAAHIFGDRAPIIERAFIAAHDDIWSLAAKFLTPEEITDVRTAIEAWRKANPEVSLLAYARFDDFAGFRNDSGGARSGGGLLATIGQAQKSFEDTRQLAERMFFYAQRAPRLLQWQTERTVEAVLDTPDLQRVFTNIDETTRVLQRVVAEMDRIDERGVLISNTLQQVNGIVAHANRLATNVNSTVRDSINALVAFQTVNTNLVETMTAAGRLYAMVNSNAAPPGAAAVSTGTPAGTPFDINHYTVAAERLAEATRELAGLVKNTEQMLASQAWTHRVTEINDAARQRVDHITWRVLQVIAAFFVMLLLYAGLAARLKK
jgi:hypothetical protein